MDEQDFRVEIKAIQLPWTLKTDNLKTNIAYDLMVIMWDKNYHYTLQR